MSGIQMHQVNMSAWSLCASACFKNVRGSKRKMFHWFPFLGSIRPLTTAVIWPNYWFGEANARASMLWHRYHNGHRPFPAPLTPFYLHMLETAGPVWAIPLRGVKIIPGFWEESCLLYSKVPELSGRYIQALILGRFHILFPTRPLRPLSMLLSNTHAQNNTAVRRCLQCVGRRRLTPIQKDQEVSCKVQLLCSHPLPLCVSNTHL